MVRCLPKKFLGTYSLEVGAHTLGCIMFCTNGICAVVLLLELISMDYPIFNYKISLSSEMKACESKAYKLSLNTYAVTVVACLDSFLMVITNCCFLQALLKKKIVMITAWLVLTALWVGHASLMIIVIVARHLTMTVAIEWVICLGVFLVALSVILYGYLCTYAYWLELRRLKNNNGASTDTN